MPIAISYGGTKQLSKHFLTEMLSRIKHDEIYLRQTPSGRFDEGKSCGRRMETARCRLTFSFFAVGEAVTPVGRNVIRVRKNSPLAGCALGRKSAGRRLAESGFCCTFNNGNAIAVQRRPLAGACGSAPTFCGAALELSRVFRALRGS